VIVRYGVLCDLCGAGSNDYRDDCAGCGYCYLDLCITCEGTTGHRLVREAGEEGGRRVTCEEDT
jgi:hypothetical protein